MNHTHSPLRTQKKDNLQPTSEGYRGPNGPCQNQHSFNRSFSDAVKYYNKKEEPDATWVIVVMVLWLVLVVWAVILAMKVSNVESRKLHITFAIMFAPLYIIAYYLGRMSQTNNRC